VHGNMTEIDRLYLSHIRAPKSLPGSNTKCFFHLRRVLILVLRSECSNGGRIEKRLFLIRFLLKSIDFLKVEKSVPNGESIDLVIYKLRDGHLLDMCIYYTKFGNSQQSSMMHTLDLAMKSCKRLQW